MKIKQLSIILFICMGIAFGAQMQKIRPYSVQRVSDKVIAYNTNDLAKILEFIYYIALDRVNYSRVLLIEDFAQKKYGKNKKDTAIRKLKNDENLMHVYDEYSKCKKAVRKNSKKAFQLFDELPQLDGTKKLIGDFIFSHLQYDIETLLEFYQIIYDFITSNNIDYHWQIIKKGTDKGKPLPINLKKFYYIAMTKIS